MRDDQAGKAMQLWIVRTDAQCRLDGRARAGAVAAAIEVDGLDEFGWRLSHFYLSGRVTSNATVSRSPAPNGLVPCHMVEGNSARRPGFGSTIRNGGRSS